MLRIENVVKYFGGVAALQDVSLRIRQGEIVSLIGPNGSGKTTLFNCITNFHTLSAGKVYFCGENITGLPSSAIARKKLIRTFQTCRVFHEMTVLENLLVAAQEGSLQVSFLVQVLESIIKTGRIRGKEKEAMGKADELLDWLGMDHLRDALAGDVSYGQQKLLMLAMSLMAEPKLLLLDEPVAGVNPGLIKKIVAFLRRINKEGITIFLVEHNMDVALDIAERVIVLHEGKKLAEGSPEEIRRNKKVLEAYFPREGNEKASSEDENANA